MYTIWCCLAGCPGDEYGLFKTPEGAKRSLRRKGWVCYKNQDNQNTFVLTLKYHCGTVVYYARVREYLDPRMTSALPNRRTKLGFPGGIGASPIK